MVIAFYLGDMSNNPSGTFFDSMLDFATTTFKIIISNDGYITVDDNEVSISYSIGYNPGEYTKREALDNFITQDWFKAYAKSQFWTVYLAKQLI